MLCRWPLEKPVDSLLPLRQPMPPSPPPHDPTYDRAAVAKVWMQRGIALLSANDAAALPEALTCFENALAIRRELPFEESTWFRWLLTACWMNRGDVLTRLGGAESLIEAVSSFDEAIFHLERLPMDDDPQYRDRLALGWMNQALALRAQASPACLAEALLSLERAREALAGSETAGRMQDVMLLATVEGNRAAMLLELSPPRTLDAMAAAEAALGMCRPSEETNVLAAETGLKARHAFCHAVALLLETPPVDASRADAWIMQATDRVDEAMHLTARWEKSGVEERFESLRRELFRFGCGMLLAYQPHFLAEFLLDVLDPERGSPMLARSKELCRAGLEALDHAATALRQRGPLDLGLQGVDRLIAVLEGLGRAAKRIKMHHQWHLADGFCPQRAFRRQES